MVHRLTAPWRAGTGAALALIATAGLAACGGDASADAAAGDSAAPAANVAQTAAAETTPAETAPAASMPQELPEGVTAAMIEDGTGVFAGAGICTACHGADAKGLPNLGADLTDDEWLHSDGSYEAIVETVKNGVTAEESSSGVPMPPKGGANINEDQVKAVAAYVWSLSHGGGA
ncbi:MAG: c-type cytochrome [Gemmatimonadota bacterium]